MNPILIKNFTKALIASILLSMALLSTANSAEPTEPLFTPKMPSDAIVAKSNERLKNITAEIEKNAGKEESWLWSGKYYAGDGQGFQVRLAISPKAGVVFWRYGCFGLYDVNYGSFQDKGGKIHLNLEEENVLDPANFIGLHPNLIPVQFKGSRYLIPENEMIDFCNYINSHVSYYDRFSIFLRHVDDHEKRESKVTTIPEKYQVYILKEPIEAAIISVEKSFLEKRGGIDYRITTVQLDKGEEHGLMVGMKLHYPEYLSDFPDLRVTKISKLTCIAEAATDMTLESYMDDHDEASNDSTNTVPKYQDEIINAKPKKTSHWVGIKYSTIAPKRPDDLNF